jgi:hypothetical protein
MSDPPEHPAIRAGDSDRDRSIEKLSTAVAEGRLTLEEFSERVDLAQTARTQDELVLLTRDLPAATTADDPADPQERHVAFCSRLVRRGPWELSARSSFRCICGTVVLDLSQVRLSEGADTELSVYNFCGTVTIVVPDGVRVSVTGGGMFASQDVETPSGPFVPGAPVVRISTRGPGGTLHVRTTRERTSGLVSRLRELTSGSEPTG